MEILKNFALAGVSIFLICKCAGLLIDSAVILAKRLHISPFIIGMVIVGFGTSLPEFAVSLNATLKGFGDVAVANVVGSNIWNICLILGLCATFVSFKTLKTWVYGDCIFMIIASILLNLFLINSSITKPKGILLFGLLIGYITFLFLKKREIQILQEEKPQKLIKVFFIPIWLFGICFFSKILITSAVKIAKLLSVSDWIIGITLVAFGTSTPELISSVVGVIKRHHDVALGNIIGSNIFNILGIMGFCGVVKDIFAKDIAVADNLMMIFCAIILTVFMRTGFVLSRKEGAILLSLGILWWIKVILYTP